jgi:hypothetical protein
VVLFPQREEQQGQLAQREQRGRLEVQRQQEQLQVPMQGEQFQQVRFPQQEQLSPRGQRFLL